MAPAFRDNATRANARTAGAAALLVAAVMIVQAILQAIVAVFANFSYSAANGDTGISGAMTTLYPFADLVPRLGTSVLPIAIGVFLAFWLLVPLTADLRILAVVVRSLVASAIASAVSLVITLVYSVSSAVMSAGLLFGNSFPRPDGSSFFYSIFGSVQSVLSTFVGVTPLVMLAGVLVWLWVARDRPRASGTA